MEGVNFCNIGLVLTFLIGYFLITIEHASKISKTSIALLMATLSWAFIFIAKCGSLDFAFDTLNHHLANVSQIVFFLLGALTIVEAINVHKGFSVLSSALRITSKTKMLWILGFVAFFLSSVLDNMTTTIILVSLLQKVIPDRQDRLLLGGMIVIAANAGGAWTPIGDVTTTMLWIGGQLSTITILKDLFLPSFVCLIVALLLLGRHLKGNFAELNEIASENEEHMGKVVFWLGIGSLIFVPIFKILTGLPPFMGMLLGLSVMWLFTDYVHKDEPEREHLRLHQVITKIDISSVLFFLGILLTIDALDAGQVLGSLASWLNQHVYSSHAVAVMLGLISAIVDNVPLVAAAMGMYDLSVYPVDSSFWDLVAFCAGTGGSILVIGSAAGVVYMGMEKVDFFWYLKNITLAALISYFAGVITYLYFVLPLFASG